MIRVILHGCGGRMGRMISDLAKEDKDIIITAGVDLRDDISAAYPVYKSVSEAKEAADVVIDFSTSEAADDLLKCCEEKKLPLVICTTGLSDEQLAAVNKLSQKVPVLRSGNMSLGINTLIKVLKEATPILTAVGFDVEIIEKHHKHKIDAPSGTALMLADAVKKASSAEYDYVYDRTGRREERPGNEIGISSVRGGSIPGDHEVIFAGTDEVISFSHRAYSRAVFGKGAIAAAKFLKDQKAGMYDMGNVVE